MRRVLVTGSRKWVDTTVIGRALCQELAIARRSGHELTVVHGGADGADEIADRWARAQCSLNWNIHIEVHRPDYEKYSSRRGYAPLARNDEMARSGIDVALAFPLEGSGGTRHCMTRCFVYGVPVINHGHQPYTRQAKEYAEAYG